MRQIIDDCKCDCKSASDSHAARPRYDVELEEPDTQEEILSVVPRQSEWTRSTKDSLKTRAAEVHTNEGYRCKPSLIGSLRA